MKGGRGGAAPAATPCPSLLVQTLYIAHSLHICLMLLVIILAWGPESHLGGRSPGRHPSPKVCPSGTHVGCNCKRDSNRSTIRSTEIMTFRHFCSGHDPAWRSPRGHLAVTRNPLGEIHPPPRYLPHTPLSPLLWKCWIFLNKQIVFALQIFLLMFATFWYWDKGDNVLRTPPLLRILHKLCVARRSFCPKTCNCGAVAGFQTKTVCCDVHCVHCAAMRCAALHALCVTDEMCRLLRKCCTARCAALHALCVWIKHNAVCRLQCAVALLGAVVACVWGSGVLGWFLLCLVGQPAMLDVSVMRNLIYPGPCFLFTLYVHRY